MENRWTIGRIAFVLALVAILLASFPSDALAWDNVKAHTQINQLALELLENRMKNDASFQNTSLDGEVSWGIAWDPSDGTQLFYALDPQPRKQKTVQDWIVMGGFSGDEPEGPMALRHFYNPTNQQAPWLDDQMWATNFLHVYSTTTIRNPEISLIDWAQDNDKGRVDDYFMPQNYSWKDAIENFKLALADKQAYNEYYGKAWRAVGETMHLVSDLTLTPHVRNDGHSTQLGDADPLETSTTDVHVSNCYSAASGWAAPINYNQDVIAMMRELASWTNRSFLSKDTIPIAGQTTTANGGPAFASPTFAGLTADKNGYIWYAVDGKSVRMARQSAWYRWGLSKNLTYVIDDKVLQDQRSLALPTAVRASEAVIERFLPRFEVKATVTPSASVPGQYDVTGTLVHHANAQWPSRLTVRNGAYVVVNGKNKLVDKFAADNLNEFTTTISADPGAEVKVMYDLGGYVIQSLPVTTSVKIQIDSLTPNRGIVGTEVTILGSGFEKTQGKSTITFNGVSASGIVSWKDKEIKVMVPEKATTGPVVIKRGTLQSNPVNFTIDKGKVATLTGQIGIEKGSSSGGEYYPIGGGGAKMAVSGQWSLTSVGAHLDYDSGTGGSMEVAVDAQASLSLSVNAALDKDEERDDWMNGNYTITTYKKPKLVAKDISGPGFTCNISTSDTQASADFTFSSDEPQIHLVFQFEVPARWVLYDKDGKELESGENSFYYGAAYFKIVPE